MGGTMPSASSANIHAADAPLPPGTLLENLGLGLVIVCTKVSTRVPRASMQDGIKLTACTCLFAPLWQADQMSMLERDQEFSEDLFDYVQQLVRTVALLCELYYSQQS